MILWHDEEINGKDNIIRHFVPVVYERHFPICHLSNSKRSDVSEKYYSSESIPRFRRCLSYSSLLVPTRRYFEKKYFCPSFV